MDLMALPMTPAPYNRWALALALLLSPVLACAQEKKATKDLTSVFVTGSHIRRVDVETTQPLLVLDRNYLQRTGLSSVGDILQLLPVHVSDLNTDRNSDGNGETRVDLRNLGANRTLVLLNGHRYVNTLDGAVDVSSIPLPIVDRIEILTDGASAIYGSDAIAGVVNIITRRDYEGMEASAYYATSEQGDGERRAVDLTWGHRGDRLDAAINLAFYDQQPIWAGDRDISAVPTFALPENHALAGASLSTPNGRLGFGPNGDQLPDGQEGWLTYDPVRRDHRAFDPERDGYNYAPQNYLRTPYERGSIFAQAAYDPTPGLSLHSELMVHRRRSSQRLAPSPLFQFGAGGGNPYNYDIASDSLYNPFGQPITLFAFRPLNRPRQFDRDVLTHYLTLGADGSLPAGARSIDWNLVLIHARTTEDLSINGGYDLQRLGLGVGPSFLDASGSPRCGTPSSPVDDCVPLDFVHGNGGFNDSMFDYISASAGSRQQRDLRDLSLNINTDLFALPGGPLRFAAGFEHRRERGRVEPDERLATGAFDFSGAIPEPVAGQTSINEVYIEFDAPLLAQRRWAESFDLSLAARHSNYSTFGGTTNYKLGMGWRPSTDWLLRATASTGYRAPSTSELFAGSTTFQFPGGAVEFFDPCAPGNRPEGEVAARCAADGVPLDGFAPQVGPVVRNGSNPTLQPEQARGRNAGVVWSPRAVAGLDLTLDWWWIRLENAIDVIFEDALPRMCYRQGIEGACRRLTRDPATGVLTSIDARLHNYGTFELEGYDLGVGYRWENGAGTFALRGDGTYLSRYTKQIPDGAQPFSTVGNYFPADPNWRLRVLLALDWDRGPVGVTTRFRYYSALDESCEKPAAVGRAELCDRPDFASPTFGGVPEHQVDARTYLDLQLRWQPREGTILSLGGSNVLDHDPAVAYSSINSYDPSYDVPGRFWYLSVSHRFR